MPKQGAFFESSCVESGQLLESERVRERRERSETDIETRGKEQRVHRRVVLCFDFGMLFTHPRTEPVVVRPLPILTDRHMVGPDIVIGRV
jgi:hypothetical protein